MHQGTTCEPIPRIVHSGRPAAAIADNQRNTKSVSPAYWRSSCRRMRWAHVRRPSYMFIDPRTSFALMSRSVPLRIRERTHQEQCSGWERHENGNTPESFMVESLNRG
ncbi:unnamed protein product [Ectocarpus sp. 12 AP-2014]